MTNHHQNQNQEDQDQEGEEAQDRLTSLPLDLRAFIFSLLPLADAVRTAVLSSHWRHPSLLLPRIDRIQLPSAPVSMAVFLSPFLFLFARPNALLRRLEVPNPAPLGTGGLRTFLDLAFTRGLQELALDNKPRAVPYPWVPTSVFRSKSLRVLSIRFCNVRQSRTARACSCSNLRTLKLERVSVFDRVVNNIASSCLFLQRLELIDCQLFKAVRIHAQRLKHLVLRPAKGAVQIDVDTPSLQTLTMYTHPRVQKLRISAPKVRKAYIHLAYPLNNRGVEINDFVAGTTELACLTLRGCSVQCLVSGDLIEGFPVPFLVLKSLSLSLDIRVKCHMLVLLKLLESCPYLRDLNLSLTDKGPEYSCIDDYADRLRLLPCFPNHLEHVELSGFRMFTIHKELLSLLLSEAKVLKKMVLKLPQNLSQNKIAAAMELLSVRNGSVRETPPFHNFRRIQMNLL